MYKAVLLYILEEKEGNIIGYFDLKVCKFRVTYLGFIWISISSGYNKSMSIKLKKANKSTGLAFHAKLVVINNERRKATDMPCMIVLATLADFTKASDSINKINGKQI